MTVSFSNGVSLGNVVTTVTDAVTGNISRLTNVAVTGRNTCILIGDSITQNNNATSVNTSYSQNIGAFNWANAYMGNRLSVVANLGTGGQYVSGAAGMADLISANLAAYNSDYVVLLGGTNDITNGVSYATLIDAYKTIISAVQASGRKLLFSTITARAASSFTAAQRYTMMAVNSWIREASIRYTGVLVSDPFRALADPTSATSDPLATNMYDGVLHPAPAGAMKIGAQWAADWGPFIPPARRTFSGSADSFDATNNPYGNMIVNGSASPLLQVLGATSGTGYTGNNPAGFTIQRVTGAGTWTGSAVARTDLNGNQGNWYQAAITGESNAAAQFEIRYNAGGPNASPSVVTYQPGDRLYAEAEIKVTHTGTTDYVKGVHLSCNEYDRSATLVWVSRGMATYTGSLSGGGSANQWAKDYQVFVRTPVFTSIGSTGSGSDASQRVTVLLDVFFDGSVQSALTVSIGSIALRKVVA